MVGGSYLVLVLPGVCARGFIPTIKCHGVMSIKDRACMESQVVQVLVEPSAQWMSKMLLWIPVCGKVILVDYKMYLPHACVWMTACNLHLLLVILAFLVVETGYPYG